MSLHCPGELDDLAEVPAIKLLFRVHEYVTARRFGIRPPGREKAAACTLDTVVSALAGRAGITAQEGEEIDQRLLAVLHRFIEGVASIRDVRRAFAGGVGVRRAGLRLKAERGVAVGQAMTRNGVYFRMQKLGLVPADFKHQPELATWEIVKKSARYGVLAVALETCAAAADGNASPV